jgi:hypothetical protein
LTVGLWTSATTFFGFCVKVRSNNERYGGLILESDLIKTNGAIRTFATEHTARLRNHSSRKLLAEGFLVKQADGRYRIGEVEVTAGTMIEIKFDDLWVAMQVETDQAGGYYLANTTCSFYPHKVYARVWREV